MGRGGGGGGEGVVGIQDLIHIHAQHDTQLSHLYGTVVPTVLTSKRITNGRMKRVSQEPSKLSCHSTETFWKGLPFEFSLPERERERGLDDYLFID